MAQNAPWGLKNSKIFWGRPQTPPVAGGHPPSHTYPQLALRAKMAALPPSLVPAKLLYLSLLLQILTKTLTTPSSLTEAMGKSSLPKRVRRKF